MHVLGTARTDARVMREATALVEAGFAVCIVDVESERARPVEEQINGVTLKHMIIPGWHTSRRFELWFLVKAVQTLILSIFRLLQTSADFYHAHDLTALPACSVAALLRQKPLIFDAHEQPPPEPPETKIAFWRRLSGLLTLFLTLVLPRCAGVITVSPPIAQEIERHYRSPEVTVIRNVPAYRQVLRSERLRQRLALGPQVRIALYQGNIQANRGLDVLVRAAAFLAPGVVIVLMGKAFEPTRSQLEALIAREGVAERVKLLPPVPYEELLEWTASADIGLTVLPPDYSLSIRWCLPNKFFEYLMAGLPVLSSQLDAVAEVIQTYEVGQVVPVLTPREVGAAITAMLADPVRLACMREKALAVARREFCWQQESQHLVRLYHNILANTKQARLNVATD